MSAQPVVSIATGLPRPAWRGRIHTWAFCLSIPAAIWLQQVADDRPQARLGAFVFGLSMVALYGVSAAYHRLARTEVAQRLMQRLDHSMIFVLIGGTYTPVCLAVPSPYSILLLIVAWVMVILGVATKVSAGSRRVMRLSNALYPVIAWFAVLALPLFIRTVPGPPLILLIVGGVLYTVGAVLFMLRIPDPNPEVFGYHEIWHFFTVVAGVSHFAMVAMIVS